MDGLLIVDKPIGPTSHDVVMRVRRAIGERRIGHTGTLDPMASGVLPLVLGRATRLAQFLSASTKEYDAVVRLGVETDSGDAMGAPVGTPWGGPLPTLDAIDRALDAFRGTFEQQPPRISAKKIGGKRSYKLARQSASAVPALVDAPEPIPLPAAVSVTTHRIDVVGLDGADVTLRVVCDAGFYVRALAHDLGRTLGTGAHLVALRRTRSGPFTLAEALPLEEAERNPAAAAARIVPMRDLLLDLPSAVLTARGMERAVHGRELGGADLAETRGQGPRVRLLDPSGELVGIGSPSAVPGLLHPSIVLM